MRDPVLERMPTGHEGGASGGAGRADEEAAEAGAFVVEGIEMGCFDPRMTMSADGAIALVIGHHEDDIWFLSTGGQAPEKSEDKEGKWSKHDYVILSVDVGSFLFYQGREARAPC